MTQINRLSEALTSTKWRWEFFTASELAYKTLLACLTNKLPQIDPTTWQKRFKLGGVYLNGIRVESDQELVVPCKIEYYEPKFELNDIHSTFPKFDRSRIVFEDQWIIAYSKPNQLPTLSTKEQHLYNLKNYLTEYLGVMPHLPSRLDTSTEGLVIASKAQSSHKRLQKIYEHRQIRKCYLLEINGSPNWDSFEINAAIGKDPSHAILRKVVPNGGSPATTIFTNLAIYNENSLVRALPLTGRTHQIRVHVAHLGHSIVGDNFYGGSPAPELRLLSYGAIFNHPITNQIINICLPKNLLPEWTKPYWMHLDHFMLF